MSKDARQEKVENPRIRSRMFPRAAIGSNVVFVAKGRNRQPEGSDPGNFAASSTRGINKTETRRLSRQNGCPKWLPRAPVRRL